MGSLFLLVHLSMSKFTATEKKGSGAEYGPSLPNEEKGGLHRLTFHWSKAQALAWVVRSVQSKAFFVLLGCLFLPTLWVGIMADDYYFAARILAPELLPQIQDASLWNLFSLSDGSSQTNRYLVEKGLLPWWTSPDFRFQMLRPLAEVSHWIDFTLWPKSPVMMHVHQGLWVAVFVGVSFLFFRTFGYSHNQAVLAFVIFSISANHGQTFAWLASRNTLMAFTFGIAALLLHRRGVLQRGVGFQLLAYILFVLALLSSELGLSAAAWLFAYTFTLDRASFVTRCRRLMPYGAALLVWGWVYATWRHGVSDSHYYVHPLFSPADYAVELLTKVPTIIFNSLLHVPAGLFGSTELGAAGWGLGVLTLVLFLSLIGRDYVNPLTRFYLLGGALCLLPVAAGPAGPRTLAFVSLGCVALMAKLLVDWVQWPAADGLVRRRALAMLAWPVVVLSLVSMLMLPVVSVLYRNHAFQHVEQPARALPFTQEDQQRAVVLINPGSVFYSILFPLSRTYFSNSKKTDLPRALYSLGSGSQPMTLYRESKNTVVLTPENGFMIDPAAYFTRRKDQPFYVGQRLVFTDLQLHIRALSNDGRPASMGVSVLDLDGFSKQRWLVCRNGQYTEFPLPAVGEQSFIPICE